MSTPDVNLIFGQSARGVMREELDVQAELMHAIVDDLGNTVQVMDVLDDDQRKHVARAVLLTLTERCPAFWRFCYASAMEAKMQKIVPDDPIIAAGTVVFDALNEALKTLEGRMPPVEEWVQDVEGLPPGDNLE